MIVRNAVEWFLNLSIYKAMIFYLFFALASGFFQGIGKTIHFGWKQNRLEKALKKYQLGASTKNRGG